MRLKNWVLGTEGAYTNDTTKDGILTLKYNDTENNDNLMMYFQDARLTDPNKHPLQSDVANNRSLSHHHKWYKRLRDSPIVMFNGTSQRLPITSSNPNFFYISGGSGYDSYD